jgi:hypothetical protein
MIVECFALMSPDGNPLKRSAWLTVGKRYLVLEASAGGNQDLKFRVMSDDGQTPVLVGLREVKVIVIEIPPRWVGVVAGGCLRIGPNVFMRAGFWEDYFNGSPAAVREFKEIWEDLRELRVEAESWGSGNSHAAVQ